MLCLMPVLCYASDNCRLDVKPVVKPVLVFLKDMQYWSYNIDKQSLECQEIDKQYVAALTKFRVQCRDRLGVVKACCKCATESFYTNLLKLHKNSVFLKIMKLIKKIAQGRDAAIVFDANGNSIHLDYSVPKDIDYNIPVIDITDEVYEQLNKLYQQDLNDYPVKEYFLIK